MFLCDVVVVMDVDGFVVCEVLFGVEIMVIVGVVMMLEFLVLILIFFFVVD